MAAEERKTSAVTKGQEEDAGRSQAWKAGEESKDGFRRMEEIGRLGAGDGAGVLKGGEAGSIELCVG